MCWAEDSLFVPSVVVLSVGGLLDGGRLVVIWRRKLTKVLSLCAIVRDALRVTLGAGSGRLCAAKRLGKHQIGNTLVRDA